LSFVAAAALAVALSLDSLGVGVAYGLRRIRVSWSFYLIVALCSGGLMALSMTLGRHLSGSLHPSLARSAGGLVLIGVGIWQLYQGWQGFRSGLAPTVGLVVQILVEPAAADVDSSGHLDPPESLALGLALGLDSLGAGLGLAMTGFSLILTPLVAVACAIFVRLGIAAASHPLADPVARRAVALPGILLILLGVLRL
jgi:putative sporulation protein YtaF